MKKTTKRKSPQITQKPQKKLKTTKKRTCEENVPAVKGKKTKPTVRKNPFEGASEISLTSNSISVTKHSAKSKKGSFKQTETRTYHEKTPANMKALNELLSKKQPKKITVKL